jgi:DNA ligase-1
MSKQFSPMLAGKFDPAKQKFPCLASPKLDGVRAIVKGGVLLSRKLLPIPNKALQARFGIPELEGFDGELIVGMPNAEDVYNRTIREVMTIDGADTANFHIFDKYNIPEVEYLKRLGDVFQLKNTCILFGVRVFRVPQVQLDNMADLDNFEAHNLDAGFEGIMIRSLDGKYKHGRSTTNEGGLLKVKRFVDSEAIITGMEEKMHNANEATKDETGHTKRSTHQENQHGLDTMGALLLKDLHTGVEFKCGTGFDDATRAWYWERRFTPPNWPIVKYKSFPVGVKDKPRHPVYIGIRDPRDM